jgi:hypothetical protein
MLPARAAVRKAATTSRCRARSGSGLRAAWTRRRPRAASCRAAPGVRSMTGAISSNEGSLPNSAIHLDQNSGRNPRIPRPTSAPNFRRDALVSASFRTSSGSPLLSYKWKRVPAPHGGDGTDTLLVTFPDVLLVPMKPPD